MTKTVVLDKADRLYHFPLDLEDYFPRRITRGGERRLPLIDLGHFRWPGRADSEQIPADQLQPADSESLASLAEVLAEWLKKEYGLKVAPDREIFIGQGIRRILFNLCMAFVEHGDIVLCPEPGIPFYRRLVIAAGGVPVTYPISEKTDFKPSFKLLSTKLAKAAKILILNNPHNPLGTMLDDTDLGELIRIAALDNMFIINDAAYSSLAREKYQPLRTLRGGRKVALELFSLPFATGLPYSPFGFAVGPPEIISGLRIITRTLGFYMPRLWVDMAIRAVAGYPSGDLKIIRKNVDQARLEARRLAEKAGWTVYGGDSAPFIWARMPRRRPAAEYAGALLRRKKIMVLPGNAFGEAGEGYLRLSLTATADDYRQATERMTRKFGLRTDRGE